MPMMKAVLPFALVASTMSLCAADPTEPHLAQAWVAKSTGDGLPGETGLESYLYEEYKNKGGDAQGIRGHIFDYGEACKKIEVDSNDEKHPRGTFYLKCHAVDCCYGGGPPHGPGPDVKKWDLPPPSLMSKISYLGKRDTTELNDIPVKQADVWSQVDKLPFTKFTVDYTYFLTRNGTDTITHRIDYSAAGTGVNASSILYGDFQVQHDIAAFRQAFMPPAECLKPNTMRCPGEQVEQWEKTYFKHSAARKGLLFI